MTLANPIFLWSLIGLTIPITIHLLSRKEGKVIRLGSIRHVQETSTQQFKGIRLNEILLLILRSAMIFVFSLLLSGLQCSNHSDQKWVVVENGLENLPSIKTILDSLKKDGFRQHQLVDGFPTNSRDTLGELNYWKLVGELNNMNLSSVIVFASNRMENFKGEKIDLAPHIKWIGVSTMQTDFTLQAVQTSIDSITVRTGHSNAEETYFTSEKVKSSPKAIVTAPDSIDLLVAADELHVYDKKIIVAALRAIEKTFPVKLKITQANSSNAASTIADWCFWLSDKNPVGKFESLISLRPKISNDLLARTESKKWELTKRLNEEVALEENLTLQLAELIIPSDQLIEIARTNDRRVMPDSLAWSQSNSIGSAAILSSSADYWLVICLLALLFIERIIAYKRGQ